MGCIGQHQPRILFSNSSAQGCVFLLHFWQQNVGFLSKLCDRNMYWLVKYLKCLIGALDEDHAGEHLCVSHHISSAS